MAEYIEREALIKTIVNTTSEAAMSAWKKGKHDFNEALTLLSDRQHEIIEMIKKAPAADVVKVVRCKDCKWFVPKHILLDDGTRRAYTEEEKKLPLGVTGDVGINCGSQCMRHLYWEENRIPVWFHADDFCSYGGREEDA